MKVIVTGYAGFIGRHLTRALSPIADCIIGIDNFSAINSCAINDLKNLKQYKFSLENIDLDDDGIFEDVDAIFHVGALGSVPASMEKPINTFQSNVIGTLNLLEAMRRYQIPKIIFSSSSSVYGEQSSMERIETQIPNPTSPYAYSKLHCEHLIQLYRKLFGIDYVILRYFNVYGPGQRDSGSSPPVIPTFVQQIIDKKEVVFNGNGDTTRDFTHVSDVVNANIQAYFTLNYNEVYNIATGSQISLKDLHKLMLEYIKPKDFQFKFGPTRRGDILHSKANIDKATHLLNFKPQVDIKTGLQEYIKSVIVN